MPINMITVNDNQPDFVESVFPHPLPPEVRFTNPLQSWIDSMEVEPIIWPRSYIPQSASQVDDIDFSMFGTIWKSLKKHDIYDGDL